MSTRNFPASFWNSNYQPAKHSALTSAYGAADFYGTAMDYSASISGFAHHHPQADPWHYGLGTHHHHHQSYHHRPTDIAYSPMSSTSRYILSHCTLKYLIVVLLSHCTAHCQIVCVYFFLIFELCFFFVFFSFCVCFRFHQKNPFFLGFPQKIRTKFLLVRSIQVDLMQRNTVASYFLARQQLPQQQDFQEFLLQLSVPSRGTLLRRITGQQQRPQLEDDMITGQTCTWQRIIVQPRQLIIPT